MTNLNWTEGKYHSTRYCAEHYQAGDKSVPSGEYAAHEIYRGHEDELYQYEDNTTGGPCVDFFTLGAAIAHAERLEAQRAIKRVLRRASSSAQDALWSLYRRGRA